MHILEAVILLMTLVVFSNVVDHFVPSVPVSLIQVVLGLGAALIMNVTIPLETDWFLLLFIAPLLFNDGRRFPKKELWKLRGPIWPMQLYWSFDDDPWWTAFSLIDSNNAVFCQLCVGSHPVANRSGCRSINF